MTPRVGLSLMPTEDFRRAAVPLFAEGSVEAVEWGPDVRYAGGIPDWFVPLLDHYADHGALYAHGVHYSLLSVESHGHHARWLEVMGDALAERRYRHVTEHFGFMVAPGFDRGAPLPLPYLPEVVALGRGRLARLAQVAGVPVGLENLATALSPEDVVHQAAMLVDVLDVVDGFLLLDVHNLWCQAVNWGHDPIRLLESYPLDRVREIHVSGGSWTEEQDWRWRRDTHDHDVPEPVFDLLGEALGRCPGVEVVIFERMGGTIRDAAEEAGMRVDFRRILEAVHG